MNDIDFEKLIKDFVGKEKNEEKEIVVRYALGKESEARVVKKNDPKIDTFAMAYAMGKLIGDELGLNGKEIGNGLVHFIIKEMTKKAISSLFNNLEDMFNE